MTVSKDAFQRFQEELAALDNKAAPSSKAPPMHRLEHARLDFLQLRKRYGLSVADVVAFFPEEEGIGYLQQLIADREGKPLKPVRRKKASLPDA